MAYRRLRAAVRVARRRVSGPGRRGGGPATPGERRLDAERFVGDPPDGRPVQPGQHLLAAPPCVAGILPLVAGHTTRSGGQWGPRGGSLGRLDPGGRATEPAASLLAAVTEHRRGRLLGPDLRPFGLGRPPGRPRLSGRCTGRSHRRERRGYPGARRRLSASRPGRRWSRLPASDGCRPAAASPHSTPWRSCPPGRRWSPRIVTAAESASSRGPAGSWQPNGFAARRVPARIGH